MSNKTNDETNVHDVQCQICQSKKIYSDRFKCLVCDEFDLCGICFEEKRENKTHKTGHPLVHISIPNEVLGRRMTNIERLTVDKLEQMFDGKIHDTICSSCRSSIIGLRFKCDSCYNYNLCSTCTKNRVNDKNHHRTHSMICTSHQTLTRIPTSDLSKISVLGQGAFGQVFKANWISKQRQVACKIIRVTPQRRHLEESFRKELSAYAEISGVFILKLFGFGERLLNDGTRECYLVTELMHRGSLSKVIHQAGEIVSLRRRLSMACHIASGMRKFHSHMMIHRDIRPDNVLVSVNYIAKIGDMGIAHIFNPDERHTLIGCLPFMPPEFHRGDGLYDQSLDVFTFGLTLNELFTGEIHKFHQSKRRVELTRQSSIVSELIERCIDNQSTRRPSSVEIEDVLIRFRRSFDVHLSDKHKNYPNETMKRKDEILVAFNDDNFSRESLPNRSEPAARSSLVRESRNVILIRQHFDDMMKQFDEVREKQLDENNDRRDFNKFARHVVKARPGNIAVPKNFEEQRLVSPVARLERCRTPTPFLERDKISPSNRFDEIDRRLELVRRQAGFERLSPRIDDRFKHFHFN